MLYSITEVRELLKPETLEVRRKVQVRTLLEIMKDANVHVNVLNDI